MQTGQPPNILAHKLCSLTGRDEPKDVVDIWAITRENDIDWEEIYTEAQSKAAGVYPPAVAPKIDNIPERMLERIKLTDPFLWRPIPSRERPADRFDPIC